MPSAVVLDTSVLFPATLRDVLLRAAAADLFTPLWSSEIIDELTRNLIADRNLSHLALTRLIANMHSSFPNAITSWLHIT